MFLFQIQTAAEVVFIVCVMLLVHFIFISDILNKRIKQFRLGRLGLLDSTAACIIIEGDRRKQKTCAIFDSSFVVPLPGADLPTMQNQNRGIGEEQRMGG